jgi:hypothetical protein
MSLTLVQPTPVDGSQFGQTMTVTFSSSVTAGNVVIAYFTMLAANPGAPVFNGFSDNKGGNTWHTIVSQITAKDAGNDAFISALGYTKVVNGGTNFQVTASNGDTILFPCQTIAQEWSGFSTPIVHSSNAANQLSGSSVVPSVSLSGVAAGDLVVSIHGLLNNVGSVGTIGGTGAVLISNASSNGSLSEYAFTPTGGTISVTGGTADTEWAIVAAAFLGGQPPTAMIYSAGTW